MADLGLRMIPFPAATNRLAADYLAAEKALRPFFGGHYTDKGRLKDLAGKIDSSFDRSRAARLLRAQETFPAVKNAGQRLERFEADGGFVIATGQQSILFGGPLFVLYKALTVIKIAEYAQEMLEVPVLPVFWNASEDHDLAEVASIKLLNLHNELETVTFASDSAAAGPVCLVELGSRTGELLDTLRRILPESEYRAWLLDLLAQGYLGTGRTLGQAFSRYLTSLLGDFGLFVIDACHPALRRECRDLFEAELFDARAGIQAVKTAGDRLLSAGYELQITPQTADTNIFLIHDGVREKLRLSNTAEDFRLKRSGQKVSSTRISQLLENHPASFSPGVLMRPLVEANLLGTLCYIAGPGEIAYYAQMGELYKLRGIRMPIIYPRFGGFLLEGKIARILDKYGLEAGDLRQGGDAAAESLAAGQGPQRKLLEQTGKIRSLLQSHFSQIENLVKQLDPTLSGPVIKTKASMAGNLDRLEGKISAAAKRQNETLHLQLNKAAAHLWPARLPQERQLASAYYLARYGRDFIEFLMDQIEPELS